MDLSSLLPQRSSDSNDQQDQNNDEGWMPSLTFQERMIGCGTCMVFGYLLSFGSFVRFKDLVFGNPGKAFRNSSVGGVKFWGVCLLVRPALVYVMLIVEEFRVWILNVFLSFFILVYSL